MTKLSAKYYGGNSWLLGIGQANILIDPWFNGVLKFTPWEWIFHAYRLDIFEIPTNVTHILITQAQPDHCHIETLKRLSQSIPVLCSLNSFNKIKELGFKDINVIKHGETYRWNDLSIEASEGAPVPMVENGYIINDTKNKVYIEPHGFLDNKLEDAKIDVLITPILDIGLKGIGKFIKGKSILPILIKKFNPTTILSSTTGGNIRFGGLITGLLQQSGSLEEARQLASGRCNIIDSKPGCNYTILVDSKGKENE